MSSPTTPSIAPWLAVRDAQRAVEYYQAAFGAVEVYRLGGDDGTLEVAQLSIGGAAFWVQNDLDASPDRRGLVRMILSVDDPDSVFERAIAAGAAIKAGMHEEYGWRTGRVIDPFGHDWEMSKQLAPA
jgi:PhnB protein